MASPLHHARCIAVGAVAFITTVPCLTVGAQAPANQHPATSSPGSPTASGAPVNLNALRHEAETSCGSLNQLNGDSLYAKLTTKYGTLGGGATARALAAATDQLLLQSYQTNYVCRIRLARDRALGDAAGADFLDDVGQEIDAAFDDLAAVVDSGGPVAQQRVSLNAKRVAHVQQLNVTYKDQAKLPKAAASVVTAALPPVDLLTATARTGGVDLNLPALVQRALGDLNFSAGKVTYATQHVAGNTRLAAQILRNLQVQYGTGAYYPRNVIVPAVAAVYQIG